ncbi:MAG: hypothetical protein RL138_905 [Bacteroidota bacterium]|jgi:hypothetical protein
MVENRTYFRTLSLLSLLIGAFIGLATTNHFTTKTEGLLWLPAILLSAYAQIKLNNDRPFLYSLWMGICQGMAMLVIHNLFWSSYLKHRPDLLLKAVTEKGFKVQMFVMSIVISMIYGLVLFGLVWLYRKVFAKKD